MLTIVHGDNTLSSRAELSHRKEEAKGKEIRSVDGKNINEEGLRQALESSSLFGNTLLVIIEHLFTTLGKKQKETKVFAEIIKAASGDTDIILWEPKELGKPTLAYFPKASAVLFKLPLVLFEFLDSIKPGNSKQSLLLLEKTLEKEAEELVFYMLASRIRQLIQVKDHLVPERITQWQMGRLTNQGKSFTMDKLLFMHKNLLNTEYSFKTGATPLSLTQAMTELIIEELSA